MNLIKPICNTVVPTVLFYIVYNTVGIIPATVISIIYSIGSVIYSKHKYNEVKNSKIIGIIGLAASAAAIIFTGEEKLYYIPSIIKNIVFLVFFIVLSVQHKSVLHYLAKDFNIKSLKQIDEKDMLCVNTIWIVFFVVKILSKIAGILYMDFKQMYWIVFWLGDPMAVLVIVLSVAVIKIRYTKIKK